MTMTFAQMEAEIQKLRAEMGPVVDTGAAPIHARMVQLGDAVNGLVARIEDVPGGTTIKEAVLAAIAAQPHPSPVIVPAPSNVDEVIAALRTRDLRFDGRIGLGMDPIPDADQRLQIEGAEILGRSNVHGTDGQNPGEVHENVLSIAGNDGGFRLIQYGRWGPGGLIRNTLNRAMTIFAIDSMGDICVSDSRVFGQVLYFVKDVFSRVFKLCTFNPGWRIEVRETSTTYGNPDVKKL